MSADVLLIDNYDSFVYNLDRYIQEFGASTQVVRNDSITVAEIASLNPRSIVISPGPCTPHEAGISVELITALHRDIPILGVCLGHQAIATAFGGNVISAPEPVHGRTSNITHNGAGLFANCPQPMTVARYHSLLIERKSLPPEVQVIAESRSGIIMAVQHHAAPLWGVQFHPESILTNSGQLILANFLKLAGITDHPVGCRGDLEVECTLDDDFYQRKIAPDAVRPV